LRTLSTPVARGAFESPIVFVDVLLGTHAVADTQELDLGGSVVQGEFPIRSAKRYGPLEPFVM